MPVKEEKFGKIDISTATVVTITNQAVNQCYGVVGMANKSLVDGISHVISRDSKRGIDVTLEEDGMIIDVYVILQYGIRIKAVAESVQRTVKFHVEKALGIPVHAVNVFVQSMKMPADPEK